MNIIRKAIVIVTAWALSLAAGGALAQNVKYFTLAQTVPTPPFSVTTTNITVTFKNIDTGNSSFNSIGIKGTFKTGSGTVQILSAVSSPGAAGTPLDIGDGYFYLTNAGPFKKGQTMTVAMTVKITNTSTNACDNQTIAWHGRAFTGSPTQPATEFQQQNADPTSTVTMGCKYSYTITPKMYKGDKDVTLTATVSNPATSLGSIASIAFNTPYPAGITPTAFTPSNFPIAPNASGSVAITASAPCDAAGTGGAWSTSVTGFALTGGEQSTSVAGNCKLAFVSPPSSIVPGTAFTVKLKLYNDSSNNTIDTFTGLVTVSSDCTLVGTTSVNAVSGVATLSVTLNASSTATSCTITGKTTIGTTDFTSSLKTTVFDGVLGCSTATFDALDLPAATGTAGAFDASEGGATGPGDTGFVAGIRGYDPDKGICVDASTPAKVNYGVLNNIPSGGSSESDSLGNTVYVGSYSVTWDPNQTDSLGNLLKPVIAVVVTLQAEWGDAATGLPTHKTLVCTTVPCTLAPYDNSGNVNTGWKPAPACLSTMVLHSSLPTGEKACLASERWDVVPTSECSGDPPAGAVPAGGRCLKPTSVLIMGDDPVFGR